MNAEATREQTRNTEEELLQQTMRAMLESLTPTQRADVVRAIMSEEVDDEEQGDQVADRKESQANTIAGKRDTL